MYSCGWMMWEDNVSLFQTFEISHSNDNGGKVELSLTNEKLTRGAPIQYQYRSDNRLKYLYSVLMKVTDTKN